MFALVFSIVYKQYVQGISFAKRLLYNNDLCVLFYQSTAHTHTHIPKIALREEYFDTLVGVSVALLESWVLTITIVMLEITSYRLVLGEVFALLQSVVLSVPASATITTANRRSIFRHLLETIGEWDTNCGYDDDMFKFYWVQQFQHKWYE